MRPDIPGRAGDHREQLVLRYIRALDEGNADGIDSVLAAAEHDPALDRLIAEVNQEVYEQAALSPLAPDAATVRALLRRHLPSAFPEPDHDAPPTIGEIAARLVAERRVPEADQVASQGLLASTRPLPARLTRAGISALATEVGAALSERYWARFRDAAIAASMRRAHRHAQLAATRLARERPAGYAFAPPAARPVVDVSAAVRRVYAGAGLDVERAGVGIAPLPELLASQPIVVAEIARLTYRRAAEYLLRELGLTIEPPTQADVRLSGFLFCLLHNGTLYGCIVVNADDPVVRRRFSLAHELGHYVCHFLPLVHSGSASVVAWEGLTYSSDDEDALPAGHLSASEAVETLSAAQSAAIGPWAEEQANAFAAELLVPERACRLGVERYAAWRRQPALLVRRLAGEFLVSRQAMQRRLVTLGLIDPPPGGRGRGAG
jgi:hypothetical protein